MVSLHQGNDRATARGFRADSFAATQLRNWWPFSGALGASSRALQLFITLCGVFVVAFVDLVTGELSFFVFYFLPVSFAAWNIGLRSAVGAALLCTGGWLAVETLSGHRYSENWILFANTMIRFSSYTVLGYFVSKLKQSRLALKEYAEMLEERVAQRTLKLQEQVGDLETFAYSVTHNLRAPLRAIEGMAHGLQERMPAGDSEARADLNRIQAAATRMDRLIMDLVAYVELTTAEPEQRPTEVSPLLSEAIHAKESSISRSSAEILIENRIPTVWGDNRMLYEVLLQVLDNAVKFSAPGCRPVIKIGSDDQADNRVRIWVKDNGIGINPKHQERIFGMFEQLHSHDAYGGGTGMGLAIAKKCVAKMRGSIGVVSEGEGHGATFWITLRKYEGAKETLTA